MLMLQEQYACVESAFGGKTRNRDETFMNNRICLYDAHALHAQHTK